MEGTSGCERIDEKNLFLNFEKKRVFTKKLTAASIRQSHVPIYLKICITSCIGSRKLMQETVIKNKCTVQAFERDIFVSKPMIDSSKIRHTYL